MPSLRSQLIYQGEIIHYFSLFQILESQQLNAEILAGKYSLTMAQKRTIYHEMRLEFLKQLENITDSDIRKNWIPWKMDTGKQETANTQVRSFLNPTNACDEIFYQFPFLMQGRSNNNLRHLKYVMGIVLTKALGLKQVTKN